jgi:ankyrin repeat protein
MAIYGENSEIAELLIINGADVNLTDEDGYNPLDKALTGNKTEIAAVLRAHGAVEEYAPNNSMDTGTTWLLIIGWSLGIVLLILSFLDKGRRGRRGGSGGEGGCGGGCGGCGGGGCGGGE